MLAHEKFNWSGSAILSTRLPWGKLLSARLRSLAKSLPVRRGETCQLYLAYTLMRGFDVIWATKHSGFRSHQAWNKESTPEWPILKCYTKVIRTLDPGVKLGSIGTGSPLMILGKWSAQFLRSQLKHGDNYNNYYNRQRSLSLQDF